MSFEPIDFGGLAAALRERAHILVPQWLPRGVERNGRWYIGDFDGADGESANVNLQTGQWIDNGAPDEDVGGDLLSLYKRIFGHHTMRDAALAVMAELGWRREVATPTRTSAPAAPPEPSAPPADLPASAQEAPTHSADAASTAAGKPNRWGPVAPVPRHVQQPTRFIHDFRDRTNDTWVNFEATQVWDWVFEGERYGYTARFERIDSKGQRVKDVLPLTWCKDNEDPRGAHRWHWKQWAAPRPLYVPRQQLSGDPGRVPVVICEGEKKALAGHQLLGDEFDFVAWPGGAKAWPLARWGWLMGRTVYLWPDADAQRVALSRESKAAGVDPATKPFRPLGKQAGYQAMVGIGQLLMAEHGCTVFMLPMDAPGTQPDGWDLADAIEEGWDAARVRDHIRSSRVFVPPDDAARAAAGIDGAGQGISTPSRAAAGGGESAAGSADADDLSWAWTKHLLRAQKTEAVLAVRENVVTALDGRPDRRVPGIESCAGLIAFNEFSNTVCKTREAPWGSPEGEWLEADELQLGDWLVREHYMPSMARQALEEAVLIVAKRHSFHPVRDRMVALRGRWDGLNRLDTWLRLTCLEEDEWDDRDPLQQYLSLAGKWFLMAMVARVLPTRRRGALTVCGPGTKFDYMLILEGPQGWGKSSLAKVLGGEYFADTGLEIGNKDSLMNIQGVLVYEWGELENLTRQEVGKVKLFVSSPEDRFRATFDRRPAKYPRQVVFVGTTNEAHYLTDTTGNRRFWPVRLTRPPDLDYLRANLDQMLAEAVHRVDAEERFYPTRDEQRHLFDPQQSDRTVESSLEGSIRKLLFDEDQNVPHGRSNLALVSEVGMQELLDRAGYTIDKQTDAVVKKAGALMHMLGWQVRRTSEPGRPRKYVRPKASDRPAQPAAAAAPGGSHSSPALAPPGVGIPSTTATDDEPPF